MVTVDLITGFLGSGKTTFIKKYARYCASLGEKVGIIENDYGAINVDMILLNEELKDTCGIEMVIGGDEDCRRRRLKTKLIAMAMEKYDRVIIEPSGIYDVDEFFDIINEEPLDTWYEAGNVIAIVDAMMPEDISVQTKYLLTSQVADAGIMLVSKINGEVSGGLDVLFEVVKNALSENKCDRVYDKEGSDVIAKDWNELGDEDMARISKAGYSFHSHIKKQVAANNNYRSLFFFESGLDKDGVLSFADKLFADDKVGRIMRVKGFVKEDEKWYQINATSRERSFEEIGSGQEVIIVIGENIDEEKVKNMI